MLAGCGSSTTTTSAPTITQAAVAAATTTAAEAIPKTLTKKALAEQHSRERKEAVKQRAQERKHAAEKRADEAREDRLAAAAHKEEEAKEAEEAATSNAKKVVEVWKQEPAEASDSDVGSISRHLLSLSHRCSQNIPTLAAYVNSGVEILAKEGIKESPVEIAAGLDKAAPGKKVAPDCRGVLAALLVVIEKGE
jgi:rubrerythrin